MMNPALNQVFLASGIKPLIKWNIPYVSADTPVSDIVDRLLAGEDTVIVTDKDDKLSGVITRLDLKKLIGDNQPKTAKEMANEPIGIIQDADIGQLLQIMNGENKLNRLMDVIPVVNSKTDKKVIGIVRRDDVRRQMSGQSAIE